MIKFKKLQIILLLCVCINCILKAQNYIPGTVYTDPTGFVEYRAGNLPIILSAPHGGDVEPSTIPDRNCSGCVTVKDSWTKEITEGVYNAIVAQTGCYPHVITNLLHRKKFDANRDVGDAANGNPVVIQSWTNYHNFIDSAKTQVVQDYGSGTFYDMHGHGHSIQRIELGYLLTRTQLQQTDLYIDTDPSTQNSSIKTLVNNNSQNLTQSQLIRGSDSFGDLLVNLGFATVPSSSDPAPQGTEPYFSGGYNTQRHGSSNNTSNISAIQIEMNSDVRFNSINRQKIIDTIAASVLNYYALHYDNLFLNQYCSILSNSEIQNTIKTKLYPIPSSKEIFVITEKQVNSYTIHDITGKLILSQPSINNSIDISKLKPGMYFLTIDYQASEKETLRFVKSSQ